MKSEEDLWQLLWTKQQELAHLGDPWDIAKRMLDSSHYINSETQENVYKANDLKVQILLLEYILNS